MWSLYLARTEGRTQLEYESNQGPSRAIKGHQGPSSTIKSAIKGHQGSSRAIKGHQGQSREIAPAGTPDRVEELVHVDALALSMQSPWLESAEGEADPELIGGHLMKEVIGGHSEATRRP